MVRFADSILRLGVCLQFREDFTLVCSRGQFFCKVCKHVDEAGAPMALSISMRASVGPCVHRALTHFSHPTRLCSPHFACILAARFGSSVGDAATSSSRSEFYDGGLSLVMLDSVVDRAARQKVRVKAKVVARAAPVDLRSFPFAEKEFSALKLSRRVLQRLKHERLELPTDVQVCVPFPSQSRLGLLWPLVVVNASFVLM